MTIEIKDTAYLLDISVSFVHALQDIAMKCSFSIEYLSKSTITGLESGQNWCDSGPIVAYIRPCLQDIVSIGYFPVQGHDKDMSLGCLAPDFLCPILLLNSLAPGKFEWNFRYVILKWILVIDGWGISCEIALVWMSLDFTDDQSTLVQVMAWCRQATSHYLSQCWPSSMSPYGVTRPMPHWLLGVLTTVWN